MSLRLEDYRRNVSRCHARADQCFGDAADIWHELAETYRILVALEQQSEGRRAQGARIAHTTGKGAARSSATS